MAETPSLQRRSRTMDEALDSYVEVMKAACLDIRDARSSLHYALRDAAQECGQPLGKVIRHLQMRARYVRLKDAIDPIDLLKEIQWEMFLAMEWIDRAIKAGVLPDCATEPVRALMALYPRANAVTAIAEGDDECIREVGTWVETMIEADSRRFVDLRSGETELIVTDAAGGVVSGHALDDYLDRFHDMRRPAGSLIEEGEAHG